MLLFLAVGDVVVDGVDLVGWDAPVELSHRAHNSTFMQRLESRIIDIILVLIVGPILLPIGGLIDLATIPQILGGHLILRQRARLIRTNTARRAQRLHRLQILDQHLLLRQPLRRQSQPHRHFRQQSLWYIRHNNANGEDEVGDGGVADGETQTEQDDTAGTGEDGDADDEAGDLAGEGGLVGAGVGGEVGDQPDEGVVAGEQDDALAGALSAQRREEGDVLGLEGVGWVGALWHAD